MREEQQTVSAGGISSRQPYEAPRISVIGTFHELTKVKGTNSNDGAGGGRKSV